MSNSIEIRTENVHGSIIYNQVNQILHKSDDYNSQLKQLKMLERLFALTPETETAERLEYSKQINEQKDYIEQFKKDVLQLAQGFSNVEIDTDRLKRAKAFFDEGEFDKARAVFETELEEMHDNHARLVEERKRFETETLPKLRHDAEEFYILALSTRSNYANPNRFADTCRYFETSIESQITRDNLFQYAYFLNENAQLPKAVEFYNQFLNEFGNELSPEERAITFNNLGVLHWKHNEYEKAREKFYEALKLYRNPDGGNPQAHLPNIVKTLNNLAILHWNQNEFEKAAKLFEETLEIYRNLAEDEPPAYLPGMASTLNNLANLHDDQKEYEKAAKEFHEALRIYRDLAAQDSQTFMADVAMTLNNLAILHRNQNEFEKASKEYAESLEIKRNLARDNPQAYLPALAMTLNNLANLHADRNESEKALLEYEEALEIYRNLSKNNPQTYLPDVAMMLNNLAILHGDGKQHEKASAEFAEALRIYRDLAEDNPQTYLPDVAMTLNNLAGLHNDLKEYEKALSEFDEVLKIRRDLHRQTPVVYAPDLAQILINLAVFYQSSVAEREKSLEYAVEAIALLYPIFQTVPFTQAYIQGAVTVLRGWSLSNEEIERLVDEKMRKPAENQS